MANATDPLARTVRGMDPQVREFVVSRRMNATVDGARERNE